MELKNYFAQDVAGNVLPGAECSVFFPGTTERVTTLENANGGPRSNPFFADSRGLIQFAAPNGRYDLQVKSGALSYTIRVQCADITDFAADLANTTDPAKGAAIVGRGVVAVDSIADLLALPAEVRREDLQYLVSGYYAGSDIGGGVFRYDASQSAQNDGGVVLDGFVREGVDRFVDGSWFGMVADYDGTSGTDNAPILQSAINYFGDSRGVVNLPAGKFWFNGAVDFKKTALVGVGPNSTFDTGVTQLNFAPPHGIYTSLSDNRSPIHKDFMIASPDIRTKNGQILVDLTGLNYPRLYDILIYGGEEGLRLNRGVSAQTHYGTFVNVDISRSYYGIMVLGGIYSQSQDFYGGRIWDCVEAYVNAEGTADINFYGTDFESDIAVVHRDIGPDTKYASTKMYGGRDECDAAPDIQGGSLQQIGFHWIGQKQATYQNFTAAGIDELDNQVIAVGIKNDMKPVGTNLLRNAGFQPSPLGPNQPPTGWVVSGANIVGVEKGGYGNILHLEGIDATARTVFLEQTGINAKKGLYTWGVKYYTTGGTGRFQSTLLDGNVELVEGVDYEGVADDSLAGNTRVLSVRLLRDIPNLKFRLYVISVNAGEHIAFESPFLVPGRHSTLWAESHPTGIKQEASPSKPTYGYYKIGDVVLNSAPAILGTVGSQYVVTGWKRITTGDSHVLNTDWVEMRSPTGT